MGDKGVGRLMKGNGEDKGQHPDRNVVNREVQPDAPLFALMRAANHELLSLAAARRPASPVGNSPVSHDKSEWRTATIR